MACPAVLRDAALQGFESKCVRLSERERAREEAKTEPFDSDEISGKKHGMKVHAGGRKTLRKMGRAGTSDKEPACQCRRPGFSPWVGKNPWRRKWPPTLVFLPGKSHGQRSLMGYHPWGHKELDTAY